MPCICFAAGSALLVDFLQKQPTEWDTDSAGMDYVSKAKDTLPIHLKDIQCHLSNAACFSHAVLVFSLSRFAWLSTALAEMLMYTCRAGVDGGAIFVNGNGATLSHVNTCAFTSNTAQGDGGACTFNGGATVLASK